MAFSWTFRAPPPVWQCRDEQQFVFAPPSPFVPTWRWCPRHTARHSQTLACTTPQGAWPGAGAAGAAGASRRLKQSNTPHNKEPPDQPGASSRRGGFDQHTVLRVSAQHTIQQRPVYLHLFSHVTVTQVRSLAATLMGKRCVCVCSHAASGTHDEQRAPPEAGIPAATKERACRSAL